VNDVYKQLNWAFLLSHKIYGGPPPASCQKAWCNLLTINLKLHDRISDILEAKLDSVLKAMRNFNGNNYLAIINSIQDFVNAVMNWSGSKIPKSDVEVVITAAQELIRPLRKSVAEQKAQLLN